MGGTAAAPIWMTTCGKVWQHCMCDVADEADRGQPGGLCSLTSWAGRAVRMGVRQRCCANGSTQLVHDSRRVGPLFPGHGEECFQECFC